MLSCNFSSWPSFNKQEIDAVSDVLSSNQVNYWTGSQCRDFELEFAQFCNTRYAVSLANGTLALDLALKALDIKPGDEIIAKGDQSSCFYIVIDGEVGVRVGALEFIHMEAGECVGEVGALTGEPRTATVVALDRC